MLVMPQAVRYICETKQAQKKKGTYKPHGGAGEGGGRPPKITKKKRVLIVKFLKKHRFARIRAPDVKRHLKLKASVRSVRRVINDAGYKLPKLVNRRRLTKENKAARVSWTRGKLKGTVAHWKGFAYGDAPFWHLPRTLSELEASRGANSRPVYRKAKERKDPRFHGGKKGTYNQGKKVGVFGVLVHGKLSVAWVPKGKFNAAFFAKTVRTYFPAWTEGKTGVVLDGETCMHGNLANDALKEVKVEVLKLPANSPDLNPIENVWAFMNERLEKTDPGTLEDEAAFRQRVENAVRWLNTGVGPQGKPNKQTCERTIESMPRRLRALVDLDGARTGY